MLATDISCSTETICLLTVQIRCAARSSAGDGQSLAACLQHYRASLRAHSRQSSTLDLASSHHGHRLLELPPTILHGQLDDAARAEAAAPRPPLPPRAVWRRPASYTPSLPFTGPYPQRRASWTKPRRRGLTRLPPPLMPSGRPQFDSPRYRHPGVSPSCHSGRIRQLASSQCEAWLFVSATFQRDAPVTVYQTLPGIATVRFAVATSIPSCPSTALRRISSYPDCAAAPRSASHI